MTVESGKGTCCEESKAWHGDLAEPHLNSDELRHAIALDIESPKLTMHTVSFDHTYSPLYPSSLPVFIPSFQGQLTPRLQESA